jgi:hypothetical protein
MKCARGPAPLVLPATTIDLNGDERASPPMSTDGDRDSVNTLYLGTASGWSRVGAAIPSDRPDQLGAGQAYAEQAQFAAVFRRAGGRHVELSARPLQKEIVMTANNWIRCAALLTWGWAASAAAITHTDVVECGLPDGSKLVLRSKYDRSPLPIPTGRHGSLISKRESWMATYRDGQGRKSEVPGATEYSGQLLLDIACADYGMKHGVPMAKYTFRRADGSWQSLAEFPFAQLDVRVDPQQSFLARALTLNGKPFVEPVTPPACDCAR